MQLILVYSFKMNLIDSFLISSDALQVADYQFVNLIAEKNKLVVEMKVHDQSIISIN